MERVIEFAANHPILVGGFLVILAALIITELGRLRRGFREVGALQAVQMINRENAAIIDVSAAADYHKAHIVGAINVPVSQLDGGNPQLVKLKDRPLVVYCKNGMTANQAAAKLTGMGLGPVVVLRGGMAQWQADKQPVVSGRA
ncbi:MAG: rhodanese-like domain-containing protein [Wenzhouxiangellaceae bacterium]